MVLLEFFCYLFYVEICKKIVYKKTQSAFTIKQMCGIIIVKYKKESEVKRIIYIYRYGSGNIF